MFATRLRLPLIDRLEPTAHQSFRPFMPLVGWFVGALGALVFILANAVFHHTAIAVVLSIAATILLTGALHEDGLADSCDAFGGHVTRDRALTIMKDSRVGTYGMGGLVLVLLLKYLTLSSIAQNSPTWLFIIIYIGAHALSRSLAIRTSWRLRYAPLSSDSKSEVAVSYYLTQQDKVICVCLGLAPVVVLASIDIWLAFGAVALAVFASWRMQSLSQQRIQGYTGDVLGAIQQVSELGFYLGALAFMVPTA